jgi:transposase-like protein
MKTNNIFQKCQVTFNIPLPLRNHFYKGKKISFRAKWFCKSCEKSFDLTPNSARIYPV